VDEIADRRLGRHIVNLFKTGVASSSNTMVTWEGVGGACAELMQSVQGLELLTDYITFARRQVNPRLSDEASRDLISGYLEMRRSGGDRHTITATPRQLESLIRISESLARMRLSAQVERVDVAEAIR
jgi:DNA replication licensing factor MCM4